MFKQCFTVLFLQRWIVVFVKNCFIKLIIVFSTGIMNDTCKPNKSKDQWNKKWWVEEEAHHWWSEVEKKYWRRFWISAGMNIQNPKSHHVVAPLFTIALQRINDWGYCVCETRCWEPMEKGGRDVKDTNSKDAACTKYDINRIRTCEALRQLISSQSP